MTADPTQLGLAPDRAHALCETVRTFYERGWSRATSGNYSLRVGPERFAVTASGKHKGRLTPDDLIVFDLDGTPLSSGTPSAETLLHAQLYALDRGIGCVLHVHTVNATVLSRRVDDGLRLAGFEMLKAFPGIETHETEVVVPVVDNAQDMRALAQVVAPRLEERLLPGYLIRGHGLYAWGADLDAATRHVEAFEFLFACALEELRLDSGKERPA